MDSCQDGVRKKAKYLHDAPPEALRPVLGPNYNPNPTPARHNGRHASVSASEASSTVGSFFSQSTATQFPIFSAAQTPMGSIAGDLPFGNQQTPVSPSFQTSNNAQIGGIGVPSVSSPMATFPGGLPFDPSDPNIFNFNLEGLNFGSQYGAMEFGMLGHMSSGAAETPPQDVSRSVSGNVNFGSPGLFGNGVGQAYEGSNLLEGFLSLDTISNGAYGQGNLQHGLPHAYAIAAGPTSVQSPSTENDSPTPMNFDGSPTMTTYSSTTVKQNSNNNQSRPSTSRQANALAKLSQSILGKRQRDPSYIYETVKEPFGYVASFHKLFNIIQTRFTQAQTSRIAKALASIRPSLLASTKNLTRQDLVFMEKYFQRALFEYEEFMHQCSSPTLACRRTGEVAGVNKEFTALTGWTKEVLLGKEPNRNINFGGWQPNSSNASKGRLKTLEGASSDGPQPVFLAELMDHDSVVEFYEDYSQLAFNDSRGHKTRKCRLLKYRTEDMSQKTEGSSTGGDQNNKDPRTGGILSNRVAKIDGEHGISKLERDGKLECSYTWTIKRDMFDMPMLFIINVSTFFFFFSQGILTWTLADFCSFCHAIIATTTRLCRHRDQLRGYHWRGRDFKGK